MMVAGAPQAHPVRGLHDLEPFGRAELVGTQHRAHVVVEDLGCRAGQRREALRRQPSQEGLERQTECARAVADFER
jgi:hypothetical protein